MTLRLLSLLSTVTLAAILPTSAHAYSWGKTGSSTTCGPCHGRSASSDTSVSFSASTTEVTAGDTIRVDFDIVNSGLSSFGLNIAANGGSLSAGSGLKLESGELTHDGIQSSGAFSFDWTAPSTPGTYVLSGVGNAINSNRLPTGDEWNVAPDFAITVCADNDSDGVNTCSGDCDDNDGSVFPGAPEVCDGFDQNCDGEADEGLPFIDFYTDGDGDGYGAGSVSFSDCAGDAPSGYSETNDDCDDSDAETYPGAPETWYDGIDDDCAGDSDYDMDGDGFDSAAEADGGTDCDDTNPDINPDGEEVDGDGVDQDCDGADGSSGSGDSSGGSGDASGDEADSDSAKTQGGCVTAPAPITLTSWGVLLLAGLVTRRRKD